MRPRCRGWVIAWGLVLAAGPVGAQNWEFDARKIALGAAGTNDVADRILDEERDYRAIALPIGLIQIVGDLDIFRPGSDQFDFLRAIEYSAAPLHYIVGRDDTESAAGRRLFVDIGNAVVNRDLNAYRGFVPPMTLGGQGLAAPTWGGTIRLAGDRDGTNHGVFVGAGPYLTIATGGVIDPRLIDVLRSATDVYHPFTTYELNNGTQGQVAVALTGGYRGRYALAPGRALLAAVDYHHLIGIRYESILTRVLLPTDETGRLTPGHLFLPSPTASFSRETSTSGRGRAVDLGAALVVNRWEVGVGINGVGNRMTWRGVRQEGWLIRDLISANDTLEQRIRTEPLRAEVTTDLPIDYRIHGGHRGERLRLVAEYGRGFHDTSFRGGAEYHLGIIDVRGGGFYASERWQPTAGIGLNFGPTVSLDLAVFGTSGNAEGERRTAIAASIRINRP